MNLWKHAKALKPNTWDFYFSSKSKFHRYKKKYLVILAMRIFSFVPFVYAWTLARNEQSNKQNKQTQDMQYISKLWKNRVRSKNIIFKSNNNQKITQIKVHIMHWSMWKSNAFFLILIFDLVNKIGPIWHEFISKTINAKKRPLLKIRELSKNVIILKRSFHLCLRELFFQNKLVFVNRVIET